MLLLLGAVDVAALLADRAGNGATGILALAVGLAVGITALVLLTRHLSGPDEANAEAPDGFDRRKFLVAAAAVTAVGAAGGSGVSVEAALGLVRDPFGRLARRFPNAPMVFMGALIGAFLIGRPFALFRLRDGREVATSDHLEADAIYGDAVLPRVRDLLRDVLALALPHMASIEKLRGLSS
jgi:hypothetical protein